MKLTSRDDWRVIIEVKPRATRIPLSAFGFDGLDGTIVGDPFEIEIAPQRLGDFGYMSMSDRLISRDIEGDYRRRCEELLAELLRHEHVATGRVTCTETHTCSHCGLGWEVLAATDPVDFPDLMQDEHSAEGEPVCCEKGIAEFRTERGIPPLTGGAQ